MNDPFDVLRDRLVAASRERSRRRRRGGVALAAALVVLGGGATAAAVTLSGKTAKAPPRYRVALTPDLTTGAAGWCVSVWRDSAPAGHGCGSARSPGTHLIAGGGLVGKNGVLYAVVGPDVARVRLGQRRVTPRRDPALPPDWRLAVATVDTEVPGAVARPNASPGGRVYAAPPPEAPLIRLYDARGRELPSTGLTGPDRLPSRVVDPDVPPQTRCALRAAAGSRLRGASARVLTAIPIQPLDVIRPSYLTCATTVFYRGNTRFRVALVLGAHDTTAPAPLLPGIRGEPDGVVTLGRLVSARREGRGWLVAYSGASAKERAEVLTAVSAQVP